MLMVRNISAISKNPFYPSNLYQLTYPRPLPDHMSDPVALVKERVVRGREAGVLEEKATLQALPLQGGVLLALKGLHWSEHTAALRNTKLTSKGNIQNDEAPMGHLHCISMLYFISNLEFSQKETPVAFLKQVFWVQKSPHTSDWHSTHSWLTAEFNTSTVKSLSGNRKSMFFVSLSTTWIHEFGTIHLSIHWYPLRLIITALHWRSHMHIDQSSPGKA